MSRQPAAKLPPGPQGVPRREVARAQRGRLIEAMTHVVATVGYEDATVERALELAGVSRRTFYELFADREDCFLAAYDDATERMLRATADAYVDAAGGPERRIEAALRAFLSFCAAEPDAARLCIVEVFAAGARARERRSEAMDRLAAMMEHALGRLRGDGKLDRLAAQALVGGVHEVIYVPVDRRDTAALPDLAREIVRSQVLPLVEG